jgi:lipid-A-disaccharide synthase
LKGKKVLIVAGEASGDLHAGNLIRAAKLCEPQLDFYGMGGREMQQAGARLTHDLREVSVIGLVEVLGKLPVIWRTLRELAAGLKVEKPDLAVLVDFPDFNLRLAEKIRAAGIPVLWYISPQIWAWRAERFARIDRLVNYLFIILPFEREFYQRYQRNAHFVGHPLVDTARATLTRQEARTILQLHPENSVIALLPGSRQIEIKLLLPHLCRAAEILAARDATRQFIIPVANSLDPQMLARFLPTGAPKIKLITDYSTYNCLQAADAAVVAAGTATLETALIQVPEIIIGRVTRLTWLLWSRYTKLSYYGLPNWILQEKAITELIQHQASGEMIAQEVEKLLISDTERQRLKGIYQRLKEVLGGGGASSRAAVALINILQGNDLPYQFHLSSQQKLLK